MTAFIPLRAEKKSLLIEAHLVLEVLGTTTYAPIPHATHRLPGVFPWNGRAVPLIDLAEALELARSASRDERRTRNRVLVTRVGDELLGLSIDEAREVINVPPERLRPIEVSDLPFSSAEFDDETGVSTVVDLPALVANLLRGALEDSP